MEPSIKTTQKWRFESSVDLSNSGVNWMARVMPVNKEEATNMVQKLSNDSLLLGDQQFTFDFVAVETKSQEPVFEMVA